MASTKDVLDHHLKCFGEGDYAYILWTAETADNVYEVGTDTFAVRDGKVVVQSFASKIMPKRRELINHSTGTDHRSSIELQKLSPSG